MYVDYTDYDYDENDLNNNIDDNNNQFKNDNSKIKKIAFIILVVAILIIIVLLILKFFFNKEKDVTDNNSLTPTIILARNSLSLNVGETFALEADVLSSNQSNYIITWYSEDSSIASVDENGVIKAESEGETSIVANYEENDHVYNKKCIVIVTSNIIPVEKISIGQDNFDIKLGETILMEISIEPTDASVDDLIFESDDSEVASVDSSGYITANNIGNTTIIVRNNDNTISDRVSVNVIEEETSIEPTILSIIGLENGIMVGKTSKIIYVVEPGNATETSINWVSSDPNIAVVSEEGVISGIAPGSCTIVASTENGISDQITITVESSNIAVSEIKLEETTISMKVGGTKLLKYKILPENATNNKVTYTSSDSNIVFVDTSGILLGRNKGTTTVIITSDDGKKTAIVTVIVS